MRHPALAAVLLALSSLVLVSCFPGSGSSTAGDPAGFFTGVWHGWIAPISLIVGLFNDNVRVYEPVNTGWWYDFGFYIAIIAGFGGISLTRRKKSKHASS
jgi:hypothetical protein